MSTKTYEIKDEQWDVQKICYQKKEQANQLDHAELQTVMF